jgi:hypothetical protein
LITDGNRAFRIYQNMLNESAQQMEELREEFNRFKETTAE